MPNLTEGRLRFTFADHWQAEKYDEWAFYQKQFQKIPETKAVDFVIVEPKAVCWLIEVKDYRRRPRTKNIDMADELAWKVRDTLAGLAAARINANNQSEQGHARKALACKRFRVVLHLEQPEKPSKLFPKVTVAANVAMRLRQLLPAIDPHPRVVDQGNLRDLPWKVADL